MAADRARWRDLSPRECECVALAAAGHGNKTIAAALSISTETVKGHLNNAYQRLGIDSFRYNPRVVAAVMFVRDGEREGGR